MKRFVTMRDFCENGLPPNVAKSVRETLRILDSYYGSERTEAQLGGFVQIVENLDDFEALTDIFKESVHNVIPEIADIISQAYIKATYLLNPDFSVTVVFPSEFAPANLKQYIEV